MKIRIDHSRGTLARSDGSEVFCPICNGPCRINCFFMGFKKDFHEKTKRFELFATCYHITNGLSIDLLGESEDQE